MKLRFYIILVNSVLGAFRFALYPQIVHFPYHKTTMNMGKPDK